MLEIKLTNFSKFSEKNRLIIDGIHDLAFLHLFKKTNIEEPIIFIFKNIIIITFILSTLISSTNIHAEELASKCSNTYKEYPLHNSIIHGEYSQVKCLINKGYDTNEINNFGNTPLFYALHKGSRYVDIILSHGNNIDIKNGTAINVAIWNYIELISNFKEEERELYIKNIKDNEKIIIKLLELGSIINKNYNKKIPSDYFYLTENICDTDNKIKISKDFLFSILNNKNYKIITTKEDYENIIKIFELSKIGLYEKECIKKSIEYIESK